MTARAEGTQEEVRVNEAMSTLASRSVQATVPFADDRLKCRLCDSVMDEPTFLCCWSCARNRFGFNNTAGV